MNDTGARERILETASRLFYTNGYRATGINRIIEEAQTAKASFYHHFSSKEELCAAYLQERHKASVAQKKDYISSAGTAEGKIMRLFDYILDTARQTDFRGCAFINLASEITDYNSMVWKEITSHKQDALGMLEEILAEYKNSSSLAQMINILYEGTITTMRNIRSEKPLQAAKDLVKHILKEG
jgi:AcrR family transcriptional regulator